MTLQAHSPREHDTLRSPDRKGAPNGAQAGTADPSCTLSSLQVRAEEKQAEFSLQEGATVNIHEAFQRSHFSQLESPFLPPI